MNTVNKIRYTCKRDNGFTFSEIFTIEQIEAGDAQKWIGANHIGIFNLHRDYCSGLKDKNNNDIYSGDILLCHEKASYQRQLSAFHTEVIFKGGMFILKHEPNGWNDLYLSILSVKTEVVGTIYANLELLK